MSAQTFEVVSSDQVRRNTRPAANKAAKPAAKKVVGPHYVALKKMQIGSRKIRPGDNVPEADSWPRVESWIRSGYIELVEE